MTGLYRHHKSGQEDGCEWSTVCTVSIDLTRLCLHKILAERALTLTDTEYETGDWRPFME